MILRPNKTVVTCAVTGGVTDPDSTPYLPITPEQIGTSALEAADAGAAVVHLHVRDPETRRPSTSIALYEETFNFIKSRNSELIINLTTGPGAHFVIGNPILHRGHDHMSKLYPAKMRVQHIEQLKPDICSVDFNTMNQGDNNVRINHKNIVKEMIRLIQASGTKPELELFDSGDLRLAQEYVAAGIIESPPLWQFAMGIKYGWDHTVEAVDYARRQLPLDACWSAFGISKEEMPMVAATWLLGGHVRCGLEDNIYIEKGVLAKTNAELVEKTVRIVKDLGGSIASPAEARVIYGLHT
jgi:uncharacterized protein (DUF849 family)